jgi:hypothetical protein
MNTVIIAEIIILPLKSKGKYQTPLPHMGGLSEWLPKYTVQHASVLNRNIG